MEIRSPPGLNVGRSDDKRDETFTLGWVTINIKAKQFQR
jgi:hypothetical protein